MKRKAFCGEGNRHCSECLKNAVISLLCNGEDKFLNELVNIHVLLLTLRSKASTVCTEDGRIDVLQVGLCMVIFKTVSINTKRHVTLDTSEYHCSLHAPSLNTRDIAISCYCGQASAYCDVCPVFRCYQKLRLVSLQTWMVVAHAQTVPASL